MENSKIRIVLLPGIGADERLFTAQRRDFSGLTVPKWIPPLVGESLPSYARRLAKKLKIQRPFILGGVSFGGMVALEMAQHLKPRAVLLMGSSMNSDFLPRMAKCFISFFPLLLKIFLLLAQQFPSPLLFPFRVKNNAHRRVFIEMYRAASKDFIFWAILAIRHWKGFERKGIQTFHIHGAHDFLIPLRKVKPDAIIRDGGHLINLTHSREVNLLLKRTIQTLDGQ